MRKKNNSVMLLRLILAVGWLLGACTAVQTDEDPAEVTHRARALLNLSISNQDRQDLGEVADLVMDLETGKIVYVVVGEGGLLDLTGRLAPVPFWAFRFDREERTDDASLVLLTTEEALQKAPMIDLGDWPLGLLPARWDQVFASYWRPLEVQKTPGTRGGEGIDRAATGEAGAVSLNHLIDTDISDQSGRPLGEIEDMILDPPTGQVLFVVVDAGKEMEVGEKLVPLPLGALAMDEAGESLVFVEDYQELRNAPTFNRLEELQVEQVKQTEPGWMKGVDSYWRE